MSNSGSMMDGSRPLTGREIALADIAERRRKDPAWDSRSDPTYFGPYPMFVELMSPDEFDRHMAGVVGRRQLVSNPYAPTTTEASTAPSVPRPVSRAALPIGERIRELRRVLGWTQREIAAQLGVSRRSIIRYEQGQSGPIQAAPLRALRRLESAHAREDRRL